VFILIFLLIKKFSLINITSKTGWRTAIKSDHNLSPFFCKEVIIIGAFLKEVIIITAFLKEVIIFTAFLKRGYNLSPLDRRFCAVKNVSRTIHVESVLSSKKITNTRMHQKFIGGTMALLCDDDSHFNKY
jgi:hypothetical protein